MWQRMIHGQDVVTKDAEPPFIASYIGQYLDQSSWLWSREAGLVNVTHHRRAFLVWYEAITAIPKVCNISLVYLFECLVKEIL